MRLAISYAFVLLWLAYLISSGVYLFSRGFLLSRVSMMDVTRCRRLSLDPNDEYYLTEDIVQEIFKDVNASDNLCLPQKSKVIILLIDALKYEFGVYKKNLTQSLPYENKLNVLHELLEHMPHQTRLMRFKADPPTTTLQRLKGITTGSLPTFIDMGSNFASPEINEDNIIDQMVKSQLRVVFLGDSTWTELYPHRFQRSYSYPSFDIFDLDTVDHNIEKHLPKEMQRNDWQVLIAHFLGVDHCGHKYGPLHEEMSRKLNEMNDVIRNVVAEMDDKTTLFVMGDHGMTVSGDHGGDTDDETNALLFAYTKQGSFFKSEFYSDNTTMQQLEWSPEAVTALIGFWKEKECLYNPKSPMYHNKHARVDALESIAMKMCDKVPNITTIDIRTKLNYLRSQYGRELLRVSESKKSGLGTDDIYVPTAYWFELLHFLKDFVQVRNGKSTISYVLDDRSISENNESASSSKRILSDGCTLSTDNRNTNPAGQKKRKKTSDYDEVLQSASVFLKKLSEPEKTQDKLTQLPCTKFNRNYCKEPKR